MTEYIELGGLSGASSSSDVSLFNRGDYSRKVHPGFGADRFRTGQVGKTAVLAAGHHLPIFAGHLGQGIGHLIRGTGGTSLGFPVVSPPKPKPRVPQVEAHPRGGFQTKPEHLNWNKETRESIL